MQVKKTFQYQGLSLRIVDREEPYLNSTNTMLMRRVLAPNGGLIPVRLKYKQTLKSIIEDTVVLLDQLKDRGFDVVAEMTRPLD